MYEAILFPTDGSAGAGKAFEHALALAEDQEATLHILHVIDVVAPAASLHEMIAERMIETGTELVDSIAESTSDRGVDVETVVREGDPAETIVDYAANAGIDLIVMPTHGRPELSKSILGSVTDKVIRTGDVPVTVIKFSA